MQTGRSNVSLAVSRTLLTDNESNRIVDPFVEFATEHLALNHTEVTIHKDGGKPFIKARKNHMPHAKALLCEQHAKDNILEKVKVPGGWRSTDSWSTQPLAPSTTPWALGARVREGLKRAKERRKTKFLRPPS